MPKIMLVEDDNNLREIYGERLLAEGYEIVSASDGEEALALAVKEKPDLIISDVMMPKISGFDMLDILRQTPETKNTQVIMMTALSQAEDKERADKLGADKYLVKSQVTLEDVARVVHDMLYGPEPATAEAPASEPAAVVEPTAPVAMPMSQPPTEPAAVTTSTTPVAAEPAVVPEPVAVEPVIEPAAPVTTPPAEPAVVADPVTAVTPAPEPVAPEPQSFVAPTPTPDPVPEPVTTAPEPPVVDEPVTIVEPAVTEPTAPAPEPVTVVEPILGTPAPDVPATEPASETAVADAPTTEEPAVVAPSVTMPDNTADLASEQAEVNEQINTFANTESVEPEKHTEPLVEPTATEEPVTPAEETKADDDAVVVAPTEPAVPVAESTESPEPANIPRPMDENVAESASTRKKVIEPIAGLTEQPNINELYEKEMAAEAANVPVSNPPTGAILGGATAAVTPPAAEEPKDPNNPASFAL